MIDSGDDDVVDDETGGTKGVGLAIMNDGDIQQILRQFNSKYGKSNKAGVHHSPTHLLTHSLTHLLTQSLTYLLTHSLTQSLICSLNYSLPHSFTH